MKTILVVDDERSIRESVRMVLKDLYNVQLAESGEEALEKVSENDIDLVILDILMPSLDGLTVLREMKKMSKAEVIILTAIKKISTAVEAMKLGAADYIVKPFDAEELQLIVERIIAARRREEELCYLRAEVEKNFPTDEIVAESAEMRQILQQIERVAPALSTIFITGESGTGKELIARAIHRNSNRENMPFVAVHCAAIPEGLLESELFGHERGAFTGATRTKRGMFELADGGTLFLDEVSEMNTSLQVKLLRALQEKEIMRVGGQKPIKVDIRFIAASNRNIRAMVEMRQFREDLYYRLNVIPIQIPPLRQRKEDIKPLTEHFLRRFSAELNTSPKEISDGALSFLEGYHWPGNIRELKNVIERCMALEKTAATIEHSHLRLDWKDGAEASGVAFVENDSSSKIADSLEFAESEFGKRLILEALQDCSWNQTEAARRLKISRRKLKYRMDRLGIQPRRGKGRPRLEEN
jgi:DNA-binding NtrC family response regulator